MPAHHHRVCDLFPGQERLLHGSVQCAGQYSFVATLLVSPQVAHTAMPVQLQTCMQMQTEVLAMSCQLSTFWCMLTGPSPRHLCRGALSLSQVSSSMHLPMPKRRPWSCSLQFPMVNTVIAPGPLSLPLSHASARHMIVAHQVCIFSALKKGEHILPLPVD